LLLLSTGDGSSAAVQIVCLGLAEAQEPDVFLLKLFAYLFKNPFVSNVAIYLFLAF
jgi:hypothetical protein